MRLAVYAEGGERPESSALSDEDRARAEEAAQLGADVLRECRTELMLAFRFLDAALWHLPFQADPSVRTIDTDGNAVRFAPMALIARYADDPHEVVRDYLHLLLHCVFRHPFDETRRDRDAWSLACDIVVESIALEMTGARWTCPGDDARRAAIDEVLAIVGSINPYKIYRLVLAVSRDGLSAQEAGISWDTVSRWYRLFFRDAHDLWARPKPERDDEADSADARDGQPKEGGADEESPETDELERADEKPDEGEDLPAEEFECDDDADDAADAASRDDEAEDEPDSEDDVADIEPAEEGSGMPSEDEFEAARQQWEQIGRQVEMEIAARIDSMGDTAGALVMNLALANRPPVDYAEFLRRFATMTEEIKLNDDEFDYVFYTYGLDLYGNMPLVEPLEYQETNRVREFVIAIDTSGSTQGDLVRTFVTRTCEILRETEEFSSRVNIHIMQCDARVQEDAKIESLQDLERYIDGFQLRGGGGTDFRPVFDRVRDLIDAGEFENLRGLIYFTDGDGTYPNAMPPYDTAFVFVDDDPRDRRVPPWAMKVVVDSEELKEL